MTMFPANGRRQMVTVPSGKAAARPYMMECFLRSRAESGNPSNVDYYEEDVNVYIVDLLCMLLDPVYFVQAQKYVADYDYEVFEKVRYSADVRLRYWVYKANADHLLVTLGVFGSAGGGDGAAARAEERSRRESIGRGKVYYGFARSYCSGLMEASKGLADVLGKLSVGFEKYVDILDHMRGEYLNIIDALSDGEMFHLQREIDQVREDEYVRKKYDELLDLYLEWKKTGGRTLLVRLKAVSDELKALDPSFGFEIPEPVTP